MDESTPGRSFDSLESEIIGLFGQLTIATYRFLRLLLAYDETGNWQAWGANSLSAWLSWQCGISEVAAREQVRVARCLDRFPLIANAFGSGDLSYSKVRAITRVASEETEEVLLETARHASAAQLEQLIAAQRRVVRGEDVRQRRAERFVSYRWDADGSLIGSFRLPPEQGAVLLLALDAERRHLESESQGPAGPESHIDVSAEASDDAVDASERPTPPARLADALVSLAAGNSGRDIRGDGRVHLVIHASAETLSRDDDTEPLEPALLEFASGRSAVRIHPETARRLACSCPNQLQTDDAAGNALHLGRRTRRIRGRLDQAINWRDHGRCRAPGCRRATTQIHHIHHWSRGGRTCIDNLISLCDQHHWLVHEGGWSLRQTNDGPRFNRPDGREVRVLPRPNSPWQFGNVNAAPAKGRPERHPLDVAYVINVINQPAPKWSAPNTVASA